MRRKTDKVEKRVCYGTRKEKVTIDKESKEEQATDFETAHEKRYKSRQKQSASNSIMKVFQLQDE